MAVIFWYIFCFVLLGIIVIGILRYLRKKIKYLNEKPETLIPSGASVQYINKGLFKAYLEDAEKQLVELKESLVKHGVTHIYFTHGTFVGDDPFHLVGILESVLPRKYKFITSKLRKTIKKSQDLFIKDIGNFTQSHIDLLKDIFGEAIKIEFLNWSSGNYHYARVDGMFKIINELARTTNPGDKVLLLGHSHAGQIFALMTQVFKDDHLRRRLLDIFDKEIDPLEVERSLEKVVSLKLDFVTFGTPCRYEWKLSHQMRVLHFINHRHTDVLGGTFSGVVNTRDGDYIQQWAGAGTDMMSPTPHEMMINKKLDHLLDAGMNIEQIQKNIRQRRRLHGHGHHYLVDYGDNGKYPNFLKTIFGHVVYTRLNLMKLHLYLIGEKFYK